MVERRRGTPSDSCRRFRTLDERGCLKKKVNNRCTRTHALDVRPALGTLDLPVACRRLVSEVIDPEASHQRP